MSSSYEWTEIKLAELVEGHRGVSYQPRHLLSGPSRDSVVLLRANNIQGGRLIFSDIQIVPKAIVKEKQLLSPGDMAVCMSNGSKSLVGKSAQYEGNLSGSATVGAFCSIFRAKEGVDADYMKQVFHSSIYQAHIDYSLAGSTINNLKNSDIESLRLLVPSTVVQQKITRILQTIDQAIEKTEALIDKYQQIKAGLMQDLFTRGIGDDGKLRPPREEAPELYQETPIGWIPKEWSYLPLRKMSRVGIPHLKTGPFGSSLKGEHWVVDGTPVITIGALGEGEFESEELLFISELNAERLVDFQMKLGDVVFSRVADVGRSVVIEDEQVGWVMSSNLMRISLNKEVAESHFLQHQLSFDSRVKRQIRCKINSGGRDVANSEILNSLLFVWPEIEEQKEIIRKADAISKKISSERSKINKLLKQKSGLMHDLLTGKVPVHVDAVAEPEAAHA